MAFNKSVLLFSILIAACYAGSEHTVRKLFVKSALECSKEIPVSGDDLELMIRTHKFPKSKNAQCLVACTFKKLGMIDDKGIFDKNVAVKISEREFPDDKAKIESARKLYELCNKVNEEAVTDGDKGCERATLLAVCLTENSVSMGFTR